jgi:predicted dehydrogenase/nucleoside-diphosphate-sugar epimerase
VTERFINRPPRKIALIGASFIAEYHLTVLRALGEFQLVAVCDPILERARQFAERWNVPAVYDGVDGLLDHEEVEVAHILVPPPLHIAIAERCLDRGTGVFIEKPMGLDAESCDRLTTKATRHALALGVNHSAVFHPAFRRMVLDLAAGRIGNIEHVACHLRTPLAQLSQRDFGHWMFQHPMNLVFEQAPHPFSQVLHLLGPAQAVKCQVSGRTILPNGRIFYDSWQITIECARGTAAVTLVFGRDAPHNSIQAFGQDGMARVDLLGNTYVCRRRTRYAEPVDRFYGDLADTCTTAFQAARNLANYGLTTLRVRSRSDPFYVGMHESIRSFYEGLRGGLRPGLSGEDGRQVVALCEQVARTLPMDNPVQPVAVITPSRARSADVLVLGGAGFIGSHLVEQLVERQQRVRVMVRRPEAMQVWLRDLPIDVVAGDVCQPRDVERAVNGCRIVYHLATGVADSWTEFERINVQSARTIANVCRSQQVERLIFTSSIAAYCNGATRQEITEATPLDPRPMQRHYYARAKILIEKLLREEGERGLSVITVRPGLVVGSCGPLAHPGVGWWPNPAHCLAWGTGDHPLPFVLVQDVAAALLRIMTVEAIVGQSFNLVGDVLLSAREYVACLREALGRDIRFHPRWLWQIQGGDICKWIIKGIAGRVENEFPSYRDLAARCRPVRFDCSNAKRTLAWTPASNREQFLTAALGATINHHLLHKSSRISASRRALSRRV